MANPRTPTATKAPKTWGKDWFSPPPVVFSRQQVAGYSSLVSWLKKLLPSLALGVLLVLFILPNANQPHIKPKKIVTANATMQAPVYRSRDKDNRPYTITGDSAQQHPETPNQTDIKNPRAILELQGGQLLHGEADNAHYDQTSGMLDVDGHVVLRRDDGVRFTTERAHIDVNKQNANGDVPVLLQGNFGEVRGEGFYSSDNGKVIVFTGHSTAILHSGGTPAPSPPTPPTGTP